MVGPSGRRTFFHGTYQRARANLKFSIIIPVYNRRYLIAGAIANAVAITGARGDCEIIVVDDGSTDGTADQLEQLSSGASFLTPIMLLCLPTNRGVTAARNAGVLAARGEWILFLDSDDLITRPVDELEALIAQHDPGSGLLFFRSEDANGTLVGRNQLHIEHYGLNRMLDEQLPGECLAVVRREVMLETPFEEDLRGFEGITWCTIARKRGPAVVVPIVARRYCTDPHADRLSTPQGIRARACTLARGWRRYLRRFRTEMRPAACARGTVRMLYYAARCAFIRLRGI
jgi:glycosyltransferase involved in cell wall biosynthesis